VFYSVRGWNLKQTQRFESHKTRQINATFIGTEGRTEINTQSLSLQDVTKNPGGVLPGKSGRGVRPAFQNSYPISDQNLRFSLPYLWPDQKFDILFMTWLLDH